MTKSKATKPICITGCTFNGPRIDLNPAFATIAETVNTLALAHREMSQILTLAISKFPEAANKVNFTGLTITN